MKIPHLHLGPSSNPPRGRTGMTLVEVVIALGIAALIVGGIVSGYIYCSNASMVDALSMAATTQAQARIEEAHSAQWDVSAYPAVNQLVASNFPVLTVALNPGDSQTLAVTGTVVTTLAQISTTPPEMMIHVDCIWQYRDSVRTNSIETIRAPDQ